MKKIVKVFLILILLVGCAEKSKIMNSKQFTEHYMKELQSVFSEVDFTLTDDFTITAEHNDSTYQHYSGNAYSLYKQNPEDLELIISNYINSAVELYIPREAINIERIIPVLRSREYFENVIELMNKNEDATNILGDDYDEGLVIMFGEDRDSSTSFLSDEDIDELNIERENLFDLSLENFKNIVTNIERNGDSQIYMVTAGGNYEAMLILWTELWTKETFPVDGEIIIAIPNRDLLLVTGSEDMEGMEKIKQITKESYENGIYEISPHLYKWNGEKFQKFID